MGPQDDPILEEKRKRAIYAVKYRMRQDQKQFEVSQHYYRKLDEVSELRQEREQLQDSISQMPNYKNECEMEAVIHGMFNID